MQSKRVIWICAAVGSWGGSLAPGLWGAGSFSMATIICSGMGAIFGIWVGFKLTR